MITPINKDISLEQIPYHGRFGAIRKHDIHSGIDIYCDDNEKVFAIENGVVVNIVDFTGTFAESPWWEDTKAILIESASGVILYGELYYPIVNIGDDISVGQHIGNVKTVLKKDKGLPMCMLHIELYKHGYRGSGEFWFKIDKKPKDLLNIEILFK